ncbi:MAG: hypothetical protein ACRDZ3_16275 [Acidimicrobiia bacterium]
MPDASDYFGAATPRAEGAVGRFAPIDDQPTVTPVPGVHIQPLPGAAVMLCRGRGVCRHRRVLAAPLRAAGDAR